jgi:hypothetical protein
MMATMQDLENAIDQLLNHPHGAGQYQLIQSVEEKAYEAYVFCLCLRAMRTLNIIPILRGRSGVPNPFIFRGAPGKIYSTHRNYGYAFFSINGHDYELHAGVEYKGKSKMTHELDVSLILADAASTCRRNAEDPLSKSLIAGWECKFYTGTLDKALGRQFVGLVNDMSSTLREKGLCSNVSNPQLKLYFKPRSRPFPHLNLTPLEPANEDMFVNLLAGTIKKMTAS